MKSKFKLNLQMHAMKKSQEMYNKLKDLRNIMSSLQTEGKIEEAHAMINEVRDLEKAIAVQEELENLETDKFEGTPIPTAVKANEVVAFNKAVLGKPLSEPENALVERVGEDGGYLVPEEQRTEIEEYKRQLIPLKDFCNVIPVGTLSGKMPLEVESNDKLINFGEMTEINQSTIKFGQLAWGLGDYGDIIPISNTLLQDEKANLISFVKRRFGKKAVRTENEKILEVLNTATKVNGEDYTAIITALNTKLDPAIALSAIIITNQTGYNYLDQLVDENGRTLLKDSLEVSGSKIFKGKTVVVLSDEEMKTTATKDATFFVGDLEESVAFFDRQVYDMAISTEAGFTKYATMMRVVERFDVKAMDKKAVVRVDLKFPVIP
ncbi:phage major capsid protein [Tissierella creatinophila]|uniref:Phage capsid family protein n=1 Tax=Tissierella creatinophila DSM 6911 TaxID=1123403 RepID=A0A1U7M6F8_TISCR|nr:phage major capsid protein [Tissierella creatinophila]OLS02887.1 phage capsid family protein [Tissierella creatinophila DSM 6911]